LDLVLLDTTGRSPRDTEALADLRASLASYSAERGLASYLVQPASASRRALVLAHQAFRSLGPRALILTKFDETDAPATALEYARTTRLPLAFLCDGQDVRRHLHRPTPDLLADLVLLGRSERLDVSSRGAIARPARPIQRREQELHP
jgi:flagellar biosynthesis protein FlhF